MVTYEAQPDTYAGWSTGRYFAGFGLLAGGIAVVAWSLLHSYGYQHPDDVSSQLFLSYMQWTGTGLFVLMAMCALGSIQLSRKARGTVTLNDEGVTRQIGDRSRLLRWAEIEGFVPGNYGGVTLVAREGNRHIEIPRFLDDYRDCIAELRARGLATLPARRLRPKTRWLQVLAQFPAIYFLLLARQSRVSHSVRIAAVCLFAAIAVAVLLVERRHSRETW